MSCHLTDLPSGRAGGGRQRGAALVIALLVFAICAALIVAMKADFELFYQRGSNSFLAEQGYAYLRGAEDLASLALVLDFDTDQTEDSKRDDLTEIWALGQPPFPLEDGSGLMRGVRPDPREGGKFLFLEDLQGRFNLNNLPGQASTGEGEGEEGEGSASQRFTPAQAQFIRLLQTFEEPRLSQQQAITLTEALLDWMDTDTTPRAFGAEDDYYFGEEPAYRAGNRALSSVSELRAVANMTPALYQALTPWVTVWPREGGSQLNIHTAPPRLLQTLNADDDLMPLSPDEALAMAQLREEVGFADVATFLSQPVYAERETEGLTALLGETSSWYLLSAVVEVADRSRHLYSVLHRNQRRVESRARSAGEL
ncbi:general secretion pathway protein GspK [Parahaliea maris]|uniref:Type II secretion system protein K n=1 Tax=Parahaliea maris TaxID=2716870 RepID=A0A5C9AAF1_9GAMM|nr:type II secretion system minor pseudopilin GspK [Parahaliea maris]TXS96281.1 general secretion pathway protein GspK [Parahaliea maris]